MSIASTDTDNNGKQQEGNMNATKVPDAPDARINVPVIAEIRTIDTVGLPGTHRCDRCGAQAYVETELKSKTVLLWCAHHYSQHEAELVVQSLRIIDHRPFLQTQERAYKGLLPAN